MSSLSIEGQRLRVGSPHKETFFDIVVALEGISPFGEALKNVEVVDGGSLSR